MHTNPQPRAARWLLIVPMLILLLVAVLAVPLPVQGQFFGQVTATPTDLPTPTIIPYTDSLIPTAALTRFANVPHGSGPISGASGNFPYLGSPDAPIKIVQVSSFACGPCRLYYQGIAINLRQAIRAGQVQYTLIPVTVTGEFDPFKETMAALCASDQDAYWPMVDTLFTWQVRYESQAADGTRLEFAALKLGLDLDKYNQCFGGDAILTRVQADDDFFHSQQLQGTPSIRLNGRWIDPVPSLNDLYKLINQVPALASPTP